MEELEEDSVKSKPINDGCLNAGEEGEHLKLCVKCGVKSAVTTARMNDPLCMQCFENYFTHRFRATFGKAKVVRQGEHVLVGFNGGVSSRVLLKLIQEGLHKDAPKKLRFVPLLVFIDEKVLCTGQMQDCSRIAASVLSIAGQTEFPVIYTRLEEVLGSNQFWYLKDILKSDDIHPNDTQSDMSVVKRCIESLNPSSDSHQKDILQIFTLLKSLTAKEKLLHLFRGKLLQKIALRLGYNKILVGDNASLLSVRLLSNVAQGRGATVPLDTAFCDDRHDVMVLRPLREFPRSEIESFCRFKDLNIVESPDLLGGNNNSINRLTETFINGLQANFPSTISTIFRTGDKMSLDTTISSHSCPLCQVPVGVMPDKDVFSHICHSALLNNSNFLTSLCYGCCLLLRDMDLTEEVVLLLMNICMNSS